MKADEPRQNRIPFMLSDAELASIDEWRFSNRVATRAEAIRQLCQIGLSLEQIAPHIRDALEVVEIARDGPEGERNWSNLDSGLEALYRALGPALINRLGIRSMSDMDIEFSNSRVVEKLWNAANEKKP